MDYGFPAGPLMGTQIGKVMTVENTNYTLVNVLSETLKQELRERWVVYEATAPGTTQRYALKVRYQTDTAGPDVRDLVTEEVLARISFGAECQALDDCSGSGYTPTFHGSAELPERENPVKPGGHVLAIAMSLAPGINVARMPTLIDSDIAIIRSQVVNALAYMRRKGLNFIVKKDNIFYHPISREMYVLLSPSSR
ncbi:uncharacterized protein BO97DRAFT_427194 [Aspergillus homomorphus CBS 101889]|uniref:Uncharacterized protein n=1 Tax=Aspergillus homomorphus (strain CBS 101889) TaxID=1450537 RepID=A0A395HP86_ASPHC|nr:hypothetical protein BO97DRAFT_427194 [Aspergillus homomorphus CBS 101889]RAL09772.1 hypothetical protein BO97DRAFT_427194 [Aspergillus homomorphus CBS 101889]